MAVIERLPTGPGLLPRPAPGRMRPMRAGIRNVWEYDDQEFWFEGGRLILRGQNTAGKSKALEVLLPFVLDGDTRPERLDPFGGRIKTMYWNLVEFDDQRTTATGYVWVEFGRVDDDGAERYVTCLAGMRGQRSTRKVDTWFAVTPGRVGLHLDLAPGGTPLPGDRLREALPEGSTFSRTVRDHRAAVDAALFGLGPDRYESLLHLLLQLRRPKLSEKLDLTRLREYLSDALPPLERQRMEAVARAFDRLDEDTREIERLEAAAAELHRFLEHYRAHARIQTRQRADAVRKTNTDFDKVTATERTQREARDAALADLERIDRRREQLAGDARRLGGQLAGLDLSKVHALQEVERRAVAAEAQASTLLDRAAADARRAEEAADASVQAAGAAQETAARLASTTAVAGTQAEAAGLGREHGLHAEALAAEPGRARTALAGAADRRVAALRDLRRAAQEAGVALAAIEAAAAESARAEDRMSEAASVEQAAEAAVTAARLELAAAVLSWADRWGVELPEGAEEEIPSAVLDGGRPAAAGLLAEAREAVQERRRRVAVLVGGASERRAAAAAERERVEAQAEQAPPERPGRPAMRPDDHAPLWACVDFDPALASDRERAGLEAALEASGLLDALVGPGGDVLDPSTLDTWIAGVGGGGGGGGGGVGLAGLVPITAGPVPAEAIGRALAGITASGAAVGSDGRWRVGPLHGRWTKPAAEYVGATARADARRRRIAALTAEIDELDARLAELASSDEALVDELRRLDEAEADWPPAEPLRDAAHAHARSLEAVARARDELATVGARLARARADGQAKVDALRRAEGTAGCPATDVDRAIEATLEYKGALEALAAAVEAAIRARAHAERAARLATTAEEEAAAAAAAAQTASLAAAEARCEADELRATVGADAEAVLARQDALQADLDRANAEVETLGGEREQAIKRESAAAALLAQTEAAREEAEAARATALASLAELARTELVVLALGPVDLDRDVAQVTAGREFARVAFDKLRDVDADQKARDGVSNRFHNGITVLRAELGVEFNPYLDTSDGLEVCYATLNGSVVGLSDLSAALDEQIHRRRASLSAEEREVIERHLLAEIGSHLGDRVHAAWLLTKRMNDQLAQHRTRGGVTLRLSWQVAPDAGPGATEAMDLLRTHVGLLDQAQRATLAAFLHNRVRAARDDAEGADVVERLAAALDYRRWHHFTVHLRSADGREQRMTAHTHGAGSGGEQAKLAHLPLFAATAAYYGSARADAPHLLMLDEAFAGIDDHQRGDCMGMLVELDLDMVLTNYAEWGCYPEVPAVAVYHLERDPARRGVVALRFVWDGHSRREDDPWLDGRTPPDRGLFA